MLNDSDLEITHVEIKDIRFLFIAQRSINIRKMKI